MAITEIVHSRTGAVIAGATVLVTLGGVGGAFAAGQITSSDIKDQTIQKRDVGDDAIGSSETLDGSLGMRDLNDYTQGKINEPGPAGPQGPAGPAGPAGEAATYQGPHWSIVDRNVIGNGDSYLQAGPFVGETIAPPLGDGSLGMRTGSSTDKAAFGNQVDFAGNPVKDLETLKYSVFTTGENGAGNLPNLQFEINPKLTDTQGTIGFTTMVFVPEAVTANQWSEIDASTTKRWYMTGRAGAASGCNQTTYCTLDELQAAAPDATIYTALFSKGRDSAFSGAVDKLVINSSTFDFEPFGVTETTS